MDAPGHDPPTDPATAPPTLDTVLARLRAAADDLEQKVEAVTPARELRDQLVVQARELGASYSTVARAARLVTGTIHKIMAGH